MSDWLSGVTVPLGWTIQRLKHSIDSVQVGVWGDEPGESEVDVLCVRVADFDRPSMHVPYQVPTVRSIPKQDLKMKELRPGDLLLEKSGGTQANPVGFVAYFDGAQGPAVSSNFIGRVRLKAGQHPKYWLYAHAASYATRLTARSVKQTTGIQNLDQSSYFDERFPFPPGDEQIRIADFLDRETAQIDNLIAKQKQLIEILRERREETIRSVLICGIIPPRSTKPSGIEWIGELPAHWHVAPTRYLCAITTGSEDSGNATVDGEYPFYVRGREILRIGKYSFDCEAVMTPGDGQGGVGRVFHYVNGRFEAHQRVYVFKDFNRIIARYFYYYLSTFLRPVALAGNNKVTMESLRRPLLAGLKVPVPPEDEQRAILAYLDEQTAKVDGLIAKAEEFIALARERRAALITRAVTGKIDVSMGERREGV